MASNQTEFTERAGGQSQCAQILEYLREASAAVDPADQWVSALQLHQISGSLAVHSRIADLREQGHNIEHRNEWIVGGRIGQPRRVCVSQYRYLGWSKPSASPEGQIPE